MRQLLPALRNPRNYEWRKLRPWQKHSEVLAVAGVVYMGIGLALISFPASPERLRGLSILTNLAGLPAWGWAWTFTGLTALVSTRWPPASKTWGYTMLTGMACLWASAYLVGVLLLGAPRQGLLGALIYGLMGYLWYAIAGLANPDDAMEQMHSDLNLEDSSGTDHEGN